MSILRHPILYPSASRRSPGPEPRVERGRWEKTSTRTRLGLCLEDYSSSQPCAIVPGFDLASLGTDDGGWGWGWGWDGGDDDKNAVTLSVLMIPSTSKKTTHRDRTPHPPPCWPSAMPARLPTPGARPARSCSYYLSTLYLPSSP
jgi:hypothetical protein